VKDIVAEPCPVTVAGLAEQAAPVGNPEQVNVTTPLNPLSAAIFTA
jgi:hypothetical protein